MPHKRNPVLSENITGLSRVVRANALAALENVGLVARAGYQSFIGRTDHRPGQHDPSGFHVVQNDGDHREPGGLPGKYESQSGAYRRTLFLPAGIAGPDSKRPDTG